MAQFGIVGHKGRMGQALMKAVAEAGHEVSGGVDAGDSPGPLATRCHVLVDFSAPAALRANLDAARVAGQKRVLEALREHPRGIAVLLFHPSDEEWVPKDSAVIQTYGFRNSQIRAALQLVFQGR